MNFIMHLSFFGNRGITVMYSNGKLFLLCCGTRLLTYCMMAFIYADPDNVWKIEVS
jgi:hypothetical protein